MHGSGPASLRLEMKATRGSSTVTRLLHRTRARSLARSRSLALSRFASGLGEPPPPPPSVPPSFASSLSPPPSLTPPFPHSRSPSLDSLRRRRVRVGRRSARGGARAGLTRTQSLSQAAAGGRRSGVGAGRNAGGRDREVTTTGGRARGAMPTRGRPAPRGVAVSLCAVVALALKHLPRECCRNSSFEFDFDSLKEAIGPDRIITRASNPTRFKERWL